MKIGPPPFLHELQPLPQFQLPLLTELPPLGKTLSGGVEQMVQQHLTGFEQE